MGRWSGSCHCGAVRFEVEAEVDELIHCECSLCRRRNAVMLKASEAGLTVLQGEDKLSLYRWNTGVAEHRFCRDCGIYTFHRMRSDPHAFGVNVFCLEDFDPAAYGLRIAGGAGFSVEDPNARPEWRGPRTGA